MSSIAEQALIAVIKNSDQETARKVVAVVEQLEKETAQGFEHRKQIVALRQQLQRAEKELYDSTPHYDILRTHRADHLMVDYGRYVVSVKPVSAALHLDMFGVRLEGLRGEYFLDKMADDVRALWRKEAKIATYKMAYGG